MSSKPRPAIRQMIDVRPIWQDGRAFLLLRDPLMLSRETLLIPQTLGPILAMCDGSRDADAIREVLRNHFRLDVTMDELAALLEALDRHYLLDNQHSMDAQDQTLEAFRMAPYRPMISTEAAYPTERDQFGFILESYLEATDGLDKGQPTKRGKTRGIVCPHIDYHRGGGVYAQVWHEAAEAAREADLVVVLGTDHFGDSQHPTLTRQHYATPYGILPTAEDVVDRLATSIGERHAFAGELRHLGEHSIELAVNWLHHIRAGYPCELVPILCPSLGQFTYGERVPNSDATLNAFLQVLREAIGKRATLVMAAGDLSHVGPAFGGDPLDEAAREKVRSADEALIGRLCAGDAEGFFEANKKVKDQFNVCGLAPIYLMTRLLAPTEGRRVAYQQCPADEQNTSVVSICGVVME